MMRVRRAVLLRQHVVIIRADATSVKHPDTHFAKHKTPSQLEAGVKSELYLSGPLSVSQFRPRTEAVVKAKGSHNDKVPYQQHARLH